MHIRTNSGVWISFLMASALLALSACSGRGDGGGGTGPGPASSFAIGGTTSGLSGTVVLQNNGGDNLAVSANGTFTFSTAIVSGAAYSVAVLTQPTNPSQSCTVTNGSGTVGSTNVTNVAVSCATNTFTIGGTVSGLSGTGLVLRNNGGNDFTVSANGTLPFSPAIASGAAYSVAVLTQPTNPSQSCTVTNGSGTVGSANVTNVAVSCVTNNFTIGGTVTGHNGTGFTLRLNGTTNLIVPANAPFTFGAIADGSAYSVAVFVQPLNQTCTVANGSGTLAGANVTNVAVSCTTDTHTIGGTVSGLSGTGLVLRNNGGDSLPVSANGTFTFSTAIASGAAYSVAVLTQPANPSQSCTVTNGSGTVGSANVTNVSVSCATNTFTIVGTVSGLSGTGLVLRNNGGNDFTVSANGTLTFSTAIASGAAYSVTVLTQPTNPSQSCTVTNGSGTVGSANVTNVAVSCVTNNFTIGGTVTGHNGTGFTLRLNGTTNLAVAGNGPYAFGAIADGSAYSVAVFVQPIGQTCTVANGSGTLAGANVTNIAVSCATNTFTVGGTISGKVLVAQLTAILVTFAPAS